MKQLIIGVCMCLCACASTVPTQTVAPSTPYNYRGVEIQCTKEILTKLYANSEHYGHEYFIFSTPPSAAWGAYLQCITETKK